MSTVTAILEVKRVDGECAAAMIPTFCMGTFNLANALLTPPAAMLGSLILYHY
jgi:hypothetical protein